jgi:hypothetical protein
MEIWDNFAVWESTLTVLGRHITMVDLDEKGIAYWSLFSRWPLLVAIYLSMGLNPDAKESQAGKKNKTSPTESERRRESEFFNRVGIADEACRDEKLIVNKVPGYFKGDGGPTMDREVDIKTFITWARCNYQGNYEPLFEVVLSLYKSTSHAVSGSQKGKEADLVKDQITTMAIEELTAGCQCHNSELARFLMKQKLFTLPGIDDACYEAHFRKAVNAAFKFLAIALRNEAKPGEPRGMKYCMRPGHAPKKGR